MSNFTRDTSLDDLKKADTKLKVQRNDTNNTWVACVELTDGHKVHAENYDRYTAVLEAKTRARDYEANKVEAKPAVIGYRKLSDTEIALMNKIKTKGAELGELVAELQSIDELDQRAIAIGKTEVQTGLMWLVRGVAQPESF